MPLDLVGNCSRSKTPSGQCPFWCKVFFWNCYKDILSSRKTYPESLIFSFGAMEPGSHLVGQWTSTWITLSGEAFQQHELSFALWNLLSDNETRNPIALNNKFDKDMWIKLWKCRQCHSSSKPHIMAKRADFAGWNSNGNFRAISYHLRWTFVLCLSAGMSPMSGHWHRGETIMLILVIATRGIRLWSQWEATSVDVKGPELWTSIKC